MELRKTISIKLKVAEDQEKELNLLFDEFKKAVNFAISKFEEREKKAQKKFKEIPKEQREKTKCGVCEKERELVFTDWKIKVCRGCFGREFSAPTVRKLITPTKDREISKKEDITKKIITSQIQNLKYQSKLKILAQRI